MDYNRNNQNGDNQWDRWNSNASHSSYYNQPTHKPYGQAFTIASLVCGLLSITIGFCGLALPLGALGILFALLTYRKGKRMDGTGLSGLITSSLGCALGVLIIVFVFLSQRFMPLLLRQELQDDTTRQQMEYMYDSLFRDSLGMEFEEYLENFYNITIDE